MTATAVEPELETNTDGPSDLRHAYCTWCNPAYVVEVEGAVAACGYRRPPGPILPDTSPTCLVCDDLVDGAIRGGSLTCRNPACPAKGFRP